MRFFTSKLSVCANLSGLILAAILFFIDITIAQRSTRWAEGSLRLVGGRSKNEGTVLIYHWSRWGAICDDYWDIRDANVVCNELGFAGAKEAHRRSRFGKGRRKCLALFFMFKMAMVYKNNLCIFKTVVQIP